MGGGQILCAVVIPIGGEPLVFRADRLRCTFGNEKRLLSALIEELCKHELLIGLNSERFDWPFIKSRAIRFGLKIPQPYPLSYDLKNAFRRSGLRTVDNGFGKPTAAMDMQVDFFGLEQRKSKVGYPNWRWQTVIGKKALREKTMDELVEHCKCDVAMSYELYYCNIQNDPSPIVRRLK